MPLVEKSHFFHCRDNISEKPLCPCRAIDINAHTDIDKWTEKEGNSWRSRNESQEMKNVSVELSGCGAAFLQGLESIKEEVQ